MRERWIDGMKTILCIGLALVLSGIGVVIRGGHPALAQEKKPVKIGFSIAMTGTLSAGGKSSLLGRQIWLDDINARGGILGRPVQFVYYDDQSSAAVSPGLYAKLIDVDKAEILYAPYGSMPVSSVLPIIKQRELLLFGNFATWANEELKYERYFHIAPWGDKAAAWTGGFTRLAASKGLKTLALLTCDAEGAIYGREMNFNVARELGLTVVYDQKYPLGTVEFSSILRAINAKNPDAVCGNMYPNETVAMIRSLDEIGVSDSIKLFGGGLVGTQSGPILEQLGQALNGIVSYHTYVPEKTMDFPGIRKFMDVYQSKAKEAKVDELGYYMAPFNYAMGQVIEQAVNATRTLDNKVLAKYMHEHEFDTLVGKFRFGPTGEWTKSRAVFVQFQGVKGTGLDQFKRPGTQVIVYPPEMASGELKMPFAAARK
jgi:branched-chain amino acid transport system substrate-binding protein